MPAGSDQPNQAGYVSSAVGWAGIYRLLTNLPLDLVDPYVDSHENKKYKKLTDFKNKKINIWPSNQDDILWSKTRLG